ncbi:hypothetical protein A3Q56_05174 [Intoshia linei]|uniref:Synaptosomal-associated protein n=1 Tax=Intoshia linei TaxID=1819745 RepID=A0A177AYK5_9BILA|nr:hypothetical protein A3Q56_05174 [Intoshia linei]
MSSQNNPDETKEESPVPLTEDQNIQAQTNQTCDESLESTRRMMNMMDNSKDAGIRTLVMLDEQGEQFDRIEEGMDHINQDMKDAEKNLEGMEKCCGLCILPWKKYANLILNLIVESFRNKNFEKSGTYTEAWGDNKDGKVNPNGPRVTVGQKTGNAAGFITRINNDAREDEMETNLVEVSGMIGNLRNMAIDMGSEVNSQRDQLVRINQKAESNQTRIVEANKRAGKLLK